MQFIEIPEFPTLRGEKAVKALHDFMKEVEEQRGKELTDRQTSSLIKLAQGLIFSIETEERSAASDKKIKETRFVGQLKKAMTNAFQNQSEHTKIVSY